MLSSFLPCHSKSFHHFFIEKEDLEEQEVVVGKWVGIMEYAGSRDQGSKVRSSMLVSTGRHSPLERQEEEDWSLGRRLPSHPDPVLSERRSGSSMDAPSWASGCEFAATGLREGKGEDEHGFSEEITGCNINVYIINVVPQLQKHMETFLV